MSIQFVKQKTSGGCGQACLEMALGREKLYPNEIEAILNANGKAQWFRPSHRYGMTIEEYCQETIGTAVVSITDKSHWHFIFRQDDAIFDPANEMPCNIADYNRKNWFVTSIILKN